MDRQIACIVLATGLAAIAADRPVATITAPDAFTLNGVRVAANGVPSWPLAAGDEVNTLNSAAVIRFGDQGQVAIDKGSGLKLERNETGLIARLTSGSMRFRLDPAAHIQVFALAQRVDSQSDREDGVAIDRGKVVISKARGPALDPQHKHPKLPGRSQGE